MEYSGGNERTINSDSIIQLSPTNFIRNGHYNYDSGDISYRGSYGRYWQSRVYSEAHARNLTFYSTALLPQNSSLKGYGFTVRCLVR